MLALRITCTFNLTVSISFIFCVSILARFRIVLSFYHFFHIQSRGLIGRVHSICREPQVIHYAKSLIRMKQLSSEAPFWSYLHPENRNTLEYLKTLSHFYWIKSLGCLWLLSALIICCSSFKAVWWPVILSQRGKWKVIYNW